MPVTTFPDADALLLCGYPSGELEAELVGWLEKGADRHVVVFADRGDFPHERWMVVSSDREGMERVARKFIFLRLAFLDGDEAFKQEMALIQRREFLLASDYQDRGLGQLENYLANGTKAAKKGTDLFGKFKGVPAVICGAGPSLEVVADVLPELKEKALIFGGGTALSSLLKLGVSPHFGGAIDPHPPQKRMDGMPLVPLFFQSRVHHELLGNWEGERLWMPGSQHDLFEEEWLDGGWNVSTFLALIAYQLGCSPIILAGVDLSQTREKTYAGNLPRTEGGDLVPVEGSHLMSRVDWLFARDWLAKFAESHPDVEWIQGTPGGLDIEGFVRKDLREMDFEEQVIDIAGALAGAGEREGASNESLLESYERIEKWCQEIVGIAEQSFPNPPMQNGEYVLLTVEIEKEEAYQKHLAPVWKMWEPIFARQIPKDAPPGYGVELHKWLFMQEVCHAAAKI